MNIYGGKMKKLMQAYYLGFYDGFRSPYNLSSGLTWQDCINLNEAYDHGVNYGQILGAALRGNPKSAEPFN
jgi:hypothetical protein